MKELFVLCESVWKFAAQKYWKSGSYYSVEELSELLLRDRRLYEISEGGVTFSGGEPMMQAGDSIWFVNRLQKEHISVAFETALAFLGKWYTEWQNVQICFL